MSVNVANFPTVVWDGSSPNRVTRLENRSPDYEDWDQIVAELIATQTIVFGAQGLTAITSLTDSTGGATDGTLQALPGDTVANNATAANNNFAEIHDQIELILARLRTAGIITS